MMTYELAKTPIRSFREIIIPANDVGLSSNSILLFWLTKQTNSKNHSKIDKRKKQIHPAHNLRFNHDLQLEIDCIEWALKKIEVNKIPNDRLEAVIRVMIKDLEKRKDKAMKRSDTDDFWIKIESLQWVLFVIFAIKNGNVVVI
jgi:hypothetical protein